MSAVGLHEGLKARLKGRLGAFELDAALDMPPVGITALVGPSGSGKTTLLRCIAGLTRLEGEVSLDGQVWQDAKHFTPAYKRPVGFVFQDAGLLTHLTVKGNLLYAQKRAGGATATIGWDEVVDLLSLGPLLARSTVHLSGGERQRAALGRALLSQPKLLLLDEPLSSLDADAKAQILPDLERLHRTLAIPVLYVSHDRAEVARLADRVLTLKGGRIVEPDSVSTDAGLAARQRLAQMSGAEKDALALAALLAGLDPPSS
jgi:molybdate transport system ATP-binding protein